MTEDLAQQLIQAVEAERKAFHLMKRHCAHTKLSEEFLTEVLMGTLAVDFPPGAEVFHVGYDWMSRCIVFMWCHPDLKEVPEGAEVPHIYLGVKVVKKDFTD